MPEDEFLEKLRQIKSKASKPAGNTSNTDSKPGEKTPDAPAGSDSPKQEQMNSDKELRVKPEQLKASTEQLEAETEELNAETEEMQTEKAQLKAEKAPETASKAQIQDGNGVSQAESAQQKFCIRLQGPNSVFSQATNGCVCKEGWAEDDAGNCDKKVKEAR